MGQYIDKADVVAEVKKIYDEDYKFLPSDIYEHIRDFKDDILMNINTLEVKEMDLEKEYKNFVETDPVYSKLVNNIVGKAIAKHFFELGLKAQSDSVWYTRTDVFVEKAIGWIDYNNRNGGCNFNEWEKDFREAMEEDESVRM